MSREDKKIKFIFNSVAPDIFIIANDTQFTINERMEKIEELIKKSFNGYNFNGLSIKIDNKGDIFKDVFFTIDDKNFMLELTK